MLKKVTNDNVEEGYKMDWQKHCRHNITQRMSKIVRMSLRIITILLKIKKKKTKNNIK